MYVTLKYIVLIASATEHKIKEISLEEIENILEIWTRLVSSSNIAIKAQRSTVFPKHDICRMQKATKKSRRAGRAFGKVELQE